MKLLTETTRVWFNYLPYKVAHEYSLCLIISSVNVCVYECMYFGVHVQAAWGRVPKPHQEVPLKGIFQIVAEALVAAECLVVVLEVEPSTSPLAHPQTQHTHTQSFNSIAPKRSLDIRGAL